MQIDIEGMQRDFQKAQEGKKSRHAVDDRITPSLFQYDYLSLSTLSRDVQSQIPRAKAATARALDLGADKSPYRAILEERGFAVKTLDTEATSGADYVGTAEATGLPDASFELVLCTQVLEHCDDPFAAVREIRRILVPGGAAILSMPHVWFYHPHPKDHWRFTQEGMVKVCRTGGLTPRVLLSQGGTLLTAGQVFNILVYGVLGRLGSPIYAVVALVAKALDRAVQNPLLCHNFVCFAVKEEAAKS